MKRYDINFPHQLVDFDFETLEADLHSIYAIDKNFRLIYFNKAYFNFALTNDGEPKLSRDYPVGSFLLDAIKGEVKELYLSKLTNVLSSGKSEQLLYECSSSNLYRQFMQKLYPLRNKEGVIIINSLHVEKPIEIEKKILLDAYRQETNYINQCSNCRRTQSSVNTQVWDWVPDFITKMPEDISHTICPICFDYYWKN